MSDISRRDALRRLGLVLMATGLRRIAWPRRRSITWRRRRELPPAAPTRRRRCRRTTTRRSSALTDLIIPVENGNAGRGRRRRGRVDRHDGQRERAAEGDLHEGAGLARHHDGAAGREGLRQRRRRRARTELLDLIAYRRNQTPELAPGIEFFSWARRMTVDAFYTSEIGIKDIDYRGNTRSRFVSRPHRGDCVRVEEERWKARLPIGSRQLRFGRGLAADSG